MTCKFMDIDGPFTRAGAIWLWLALAAWHPAALAGGEPADAAADPLPVVKLSPAEPVSGSRQAVALPAWQSLEFLEQSFWATASSRIELSGCEGDRKLWCLQATSSVVSNREVVALTALPGGRLLDRRRSSEGSDRRRKTWTFGTSSITRERREPDANGDWRITSSRRLVYPDGDPPTTDAILLLALAEPGREQREFLVNTDINFYRVVAVPAGEDLVSVDTPLDDGGSSREVDLVTLRATPVEPLADKPDFNLLGLSGEIVIAYDRATGIPVQVRGKAPRIGYAELNLKALERRDPRP